MEPVTGHRGMVRSPVRSPVHGIGHVSQGTGHRSFTGHGTGHQAPVTIQNKKSFIIIGLFFFFFFIVERLIIVNKLPP
ncbi:hypothetical protein DPMN_066559 [Dreissena polymorpha]|uniref:Transmembrane protein n=1 Tax=Dreissena polymorpha TaxID=45954 RepID=A0A9D4BSZ7_DREPO|nr:hypothetical protein DPMN_066559 [Dreissena polymorpha]